MKTPTGDSRLRTTLLRMAVSVMLVAAALLLNLPFFSPTASAQAPAVSVSITASSSAPLVGQAVTLRTSITNAPAGGSPSYTWELSNGGGWVAWPGGSTFRYLAGRPESWAFRVTVRYGGVSATSGSVTVTWTAPAPPPDPTPDPVPDPVPDPAPDPTPPPPSGTSQAPSSSLQPAPRTARSTTVQQVHSLTFHRAEFSEPTDPALDVRWINFAGWSPTQHSFRVRYRKTGDANWTLHSNTAIRLLTARITGLEAGATYQAQVKLNCDDSSKCPWSDTGSGRANSVPTATRTPFNGGTFAVGSTLDYRETGEGALGVFFHDGDSDTLTYSASAQHPALLGVGLSGAAGQAQLRVTLRNQGVSKVNLTATDPYGGSVTRSVTITVTAKKSRSVAENAAAGTAVGAPVTGTPYDDGDDATDDALTYTLKGKAADSGLFVIDSASGQISVAEGATLDYETDDAHRETETFNGEVIAKFYRGEVHYTVGGHNSVIEVNISVTDVMPGQIDAPTLTRTPLSAPSDPGLDVSWTAPDANGTTITGYEAQYRKQAAPGEEAAAWTAYTYTHIDPETEIETQRSVVPAPATSLTIPGLEAGETYEVQLRAVSSDEGAGPWSDSGSGRANRPPAATTTPFLGGTFPVGSIADYDETNPIGGAYCEDADGDALTYSASAQYPGLLGVSVSGAGGSALLRVTLLNPGSSNVTYVASDPYGGQVTRSVTLSGTAHETRSVAENSAKGTPVGDPVTGIPYAGETLRYTLTGGATSAFVIDSASGQISLAEGASLDFETKDSYTGQVQYTVGGREAIVYLTIHVTDQPAPPALSVTRTRFSEQTNPALDVSWTAPSNPGDTITGYEARYRKQVAEGQTPNAWTTYSGTLDATTTSFNLPNLEAGATYEAQVRTVGQNEGAGPWSDTVSGRANRPPRLTGVHYPARTLGRQEARVIWTVGNAAVVGHFADDDGDALTYSATPEHAPLIDAWIDDTDKLTVMIKNAGATSVSYRAQDPYGGVSGDVNLAVQATSSRTRSISEKARGDIAIGDRVQGFPHNGETLTYTLTGELATSGLFRIMPRGRIRLLSSAVLDYETKSSYTGKVEYTVGGIASWIDVTVNVLDVEAGKPGTPTLTRTEFSEPSNPALDVTWTAAAANGTNITGYEARYRKQAAAGEEPAEWTDYSGALGASARTLNLPNLEAGATYEAQVRAVTSDEGAGPWSDTGSGQANRPPAATSTAFNGDAFPAGGTVDYRETGQGAPGVFFTDADSDTLTYAAAAQHPALLGVGLSGPAGEATLTATLLNQGASTLTFTASDPYGGSVTRTATITITATTSRSIAENTAAGTAVGAPVTGTPYDDGDDATDDALTYSLTGKAADSGLFVIDAASGQISLAAGATLDYETDDAHREAETLNGEVIAKFYRGEVHYTVAGHNAVIKVNIHVTDVEAGKPDTPTVTRTGFEEESNPALDVTWTAPAADGATITGYEAQYRKQVAEGETANAWTAYSGTLSVTTTTFNLPDLDAGATYEVQVRALTELEGPGPWSDIGSARANRPPGYAVHNGRSYFLVAAPPWPVGDIWNTDDAGNAPNVEDDSRVGIYYADPDGDTLRWDVSAEYPGVARAFVDEATQQFSIEFYNPATTVFRYGVHDGYGGYIDRTFTWLGGQAETRSVAENAAGGTKVGAPVTGKPYDDGDDDTDDALSYTLTGDAAAAFVIDSASGQISLKPDTSLDYETTSSYTGQVHWTVQGQAAAADLTINVTDIEAALAGAPTVTRTEFSEPSNPALDVTWTAAAANGLTITGYEAQYRKQVAEGETANAWTAYSGTLSATATTFNLPGLEAGATYEAQVRAVTSEEGVGPWSDTGSGQANRPPTLDVFIVGADTPWGGHRLSAAPVASLFGDADGDALRHTVSPSHPGVLNAGLEEGDSPKLWMVVVNPATASITYSAHDDYGGQASGSFTIRGYANETRSVVENSAAGTAVGRAVVGSPYGTETYTHTLTGDAAAAFVIDAATGQISVKQGASLDYETTTSYTGQVHWTVQGQAAVADLTINVTDATAPDKPDAPAVGRNAGNPRTALDVSWTAPDDNDAPITDYDVQYRVEGATDWTSHAFDGTGTSTTLTGLTEDTTYEVQVQARNVEGDSPWSDTTTGRTNNYAPAFNNPDSPGTPLTSATREVAENSPAGTVVGAPLTATDPDGDTVTYAASGAGAASFAVNSATGQITVAAGASLDYETTQSYSVTVEARDSAAATPVTVAVTINLTDVPPPAQPAAPTVSEHADSPTRSLDVSWTAPDDSGAPITDYDVQYRVEGETDWTAHAFTGAGTSTTLTGLTAGTTYEVQVLATSGEGDSPWSDAGTGSTAAAPPPPPPVAPDPPADPPLARTVAENSPGGAPVGAPVVVPNPDNAPRPYTISGAAAFVVDAASGQIRVAAGAALDYETGPTSYSVTVRGAEGAVEVTITITDVEEPPAKPDAPSPAPSTSAPQTALDVSWAAPANSGPPITDYDVRYRQRGASAWSPHTHSGAATAATLTGLEPGTTYEVQVRATNDEGTGAWSDAGTGETAPAPDLVREVAENAPAGTAIGAPVITPVTDAAPGGIRVADASGSGDEPGDPLIPSLSGPAAFVIDAGSGLIRVAEGAWLDYETGPTSYTVTVRGADGAVEVAITITDVDEPPAKPDAPSAAPSTSAPQTALDVSWTAPANSGPPITDYDVRYRERGASAWSPHAHSGAATAATLTGLEPGTTYEVQVRATNDEGTGAWSDARTGETAPAPDLVREVAENAPAGTAIGAPVIAPVTATPPSEIRVADASELDEEASDPLIPSLSGPAAFVIDAASGLIRVAEGAWLDYETGPTSYTVTVNTGDGDAIEVLINVIDVAEPPPTPDAPWATTSAANPDTELDINWVSILMAGVPDTTDYDVRYRLEGTDAWTDHAFTGAVPGTTIAGLEPGATYEVQVLARNDEGESSWSASGTGITGPARLSAARAVPEDAPPGAPVGAPLATTDAQGHTIVYSIVADEVTSAKRQYSRATSGDTDLPPDPHHAEFTIDPATGQIRVAPGATLDYETSHRHHVTVQASHATPGQVHGHILEAVIEVVIDVIDVAESSDDPPGDPPDNPPVDDPTGGVNRAPSFGAAAPRQVAENSPAGAAVGAPVTAADGDGDPLTYSLTGGGAFVIDPAGGQIRVAPGVVLDYESGAGSYTVTVYVSDGKDATGAADTAIDDTVAVTIQVIDVAEPPNRPAAPAVSPAAADPQAVLRVSWSAPANSGPPITDYDLRYRAQGATAWTSHSHTGVAATSTLRGLEAGTTYEVQVAARNDEGTSAWSNAGSGATTLADSPDTPAPQPQPPVLGPDDAHKPGPTPPGPGRTPPGPGPWDPQPTPPNPPPPVPAPPDAPGDPAVADADPVAGDDDPVAGDEDPVVRDAPASADRRDGRPARVQAVRTQAPDHMALDPLLGADAGDAPRVAGAAPAESTADGGRGEGRMTQGDAQESPQVIVVKSDCFPWWWLLLALITLYVAKSVWDRWTRAKSTPTEGPGGAA